jgi:maltooligosyltrehalose trehalohydrolase
LAVILDVVYNHLGPEGNYLDDYGPYFTDNYRTPWGRAINYDGPDSDAVRHYVVSNALYWVTEYHIDGLRLDAIHGIYDFSASHILREIADAIHAEAQRLGRSILVIAESDLNDVRVIAPPAEGGHGLDGQWSDDCHHALHAILTGERAGYYEDFGHLDQLATVLQEGFLYSGQRSQHRRRRHGNSSKDRPPLQLVICSQNHDQIGNRAHGDRLSTLVPHEALWVAAATILLAPHTPLLFMGEEYGETAPFQYFIDHGDPALVEAVRQGRRKEFAAFGWGNVPDPYDPTTYERSGVRVDRSKSPQQAALFRWYAALVQLRKTIPALGAGEAGTHGHHVRAFADEQILMVHRWAVHGSEALVILGFNKAVAEIALRDPQGTWTLKLDSARDKLGQPTIVISSVGVRLRVPAYGVSVYLKE